MHSSRICTTHFSSVAVLGLSARGVYGKQPSGQTPPLPGRKSPWADTPRQTPPPGQTPTWADSPPPLGRHPPWQTTTTTWKDNPPAETLYCMLGHTALPHCMLRYTPFHVEQCWAVGGGDACRGHLHRSING